MIDFAFSMDLKICTFSLLFVHKIDFPTLERNASTFRWGKYIMNLKAFVVSVKFRYFWVNLISSVVTRGMHILHFVLRISRISEHPVHPHTGRGKPAI